MKKLALIGAGHAHIVALAALVRQGFDVCLVSPDARTLYSGLLPDYLAGTIPLSVLSFDLKSMSTKYGFEYIDDHLLAVDLESKTLHTAGGSQRKFDLLSVNIGSVPEDGLLAASPAHHCSIKPFKKFINFYNERIQNTDCTQSMGIVGAGPGGVEIAFALRQYFGAKKEKEIHLYGTQLLETMPNSHSKRIEKQLQNKDIQVHLTSKRMQVKDLDSHDCVLWTSHATSPPSLKNIQAAKNSDGFLLVSACLQSLSHPFVFAAGDCSQIQNARFEKSGAVAYMQGPILAHNISSYATTSSKSQLKVFKAKRAYLKILNRCDGYAMASKGQWYSEGRIIYKLKRHLDYAYMKKYH